MTLCMFYSLNSESSVYSGADKSTQKIIKKVDALIAQQKFETAFQLLEKNNTNAYLVAKKVEVATNYFVQSLNHVSFAFKDLKKGETIEALRMSKGSFTMYYFDPVVVIFALLKSGHQEPILYKSLGDYYFDVSLRFEDRWTEDDTSIASKVVENYSKAYQGGLYTVPMLVNYAHKTALFGNYAQAIELYTKALAEDSSLPDANYNLAYWYLVVGNYDKALVEGDKAVIAYSNNPNYQMDAILLCADASYYNEDFDLSIAYLQKALKISTEEYRVFLRLGNNYLALGNILKANTSLDTLFSFAPTYPSASQMVAEAFLAQNNSEALYKFYIRNLLKYSDQPEVEGNLLFHLALQYERDGNIKKAIETVLLAKKKYMQAERFEDDIRTAIESLLVRNK